MTLKELKSFYNGKRVLVTGHTGFKGSWLVRILTLAGAQVTGYALNPPTEPALFEIAGLEDTIDVYKRQFLYWQLQDCGIAPGFLQEFLLPLYLPISLKK